MKIRYLGTAAAEGIPAMFCNCDFCKRIKSVGGCKFRTRSQVLIDDYISIDFPPEGYIHSLEFGVDLANLGHILVTHSHMDHFYAHDFVLRGYKYAKNTVPVLNIYGNSDVYAVYKSCTAREMREEVAKNINFKIIRPYDRFFIDKYRVIALPARHTANEEALLYYISDGNRGYLHLFDTSDVCDEAIDYLAKEGARAQLVSFDCTLLLGAGGQGSRHMGIGDDMKIKQKLLLAGVIGSDAKCIITHFSHNSSPYDSVLAQIEKQYNVLAAYDGMEVEI